MKSAKLLLFVFLFMAVSCEKDDKNDTACGVDNPLENISWLNDIKEVFEMDAGLQRQRITQYKYHGNDVFLIEECYQCADALQIVYDCEKNIICEFGGIDGRNTCPDFVSHASNEKVLYDR